MDKNSYINKKIADLNEMEDSIKTRRIFTTLLLILIMGVISAPAYVMAKTFAFYEGAAMLGCWDVLVATLAHAFNQDKKNSILEYSNEREHLKKIKKNGIKSNKEYDQKRLERIAKLEALQEDISSKISGNSLLAVIGIIATTISSAGIILNPQIGAVAAIISILTTLGATNSSYKNGKEYSKLEARINNLKNDIELGAIFGFNPSTKNTTKSPTSQPKQRNNVKALGVDKEQETLVDNYIASLSAGLKEEEKEKKLNK